MTSYRSLTVSVFRSPRGSPVSFGITLPRTRGWGCPSNSLLTPNSQGPNHRPPRSRRQRRSGWSVPHRGSTRRGVLDRARQAQAVRRCVLCGGARGECLADARGARHLERRSCRHRRQCPPARDSERIVEGLGRCPAWSRADRPSAPRRTNWPPTRRLGRRHRPRSARHSRDLTPRTATGEPWPGSLTRGRLTDFGGELGKVPVRGVEGLAALDLGAYGELEQFRSRKIAPFELIVEIVREVHLNSRHAPRQTPGQPRRQPLHRCLTLEAGSHPRVTASVAGTVASGFRGQLQCRVGVEEALWRQQEAGPLNRHDRPVLRSRDVGQAERVPEDHVLPGG